MKNKSEAGFSLIELLIVVVIIGIIAGISISFYIRARVGAENRSAVATLAAVRSAQAQFYAQRGRYGRLDEIQTSQNQNLGTGWSATSGRRGKFTFTLDPSTTTDIQLKNNYMVIATRDNDVPNPPTYTLDQSGVIDNVNLF
jgi:prepilin-type N-terminal cleavage/methylation domain-containing protein